MGMSIFLGAFCVMMVIMLVPDPHDKTQSLHHYGLLAILVVGSFLAWALDRGLL